MSQTQEMNFEQTVEYILNIRHRSDIKGLTRMRRFMALLGNPQDQLKYVHITGTNGKGSTTAMHNSVLTKAGYKAGMFVSPYVLEFRERIQIGGKMIPKEDLVRTVAKIKPVIDQMYAEGDGPVQFEVVTAIGFVYFCEQKCDIVCLEVGIGGERDSTNIIHEPLAAVFANIAFDHTNMLGNTLEAIATQKAGIIKGHCAVIAYPQMDPEALGAIMEKCAVCGATLIQGNRRGAQVLSRSVMGTRFSYDGLEIDLPLLGEHQVCNAINVVETAKALRTKGFAITDDHILAGIQDTRFPARAEVLGQNPLVILDGAHNDNGAAALEDVIALAVTRQDGTKRPLAVIMGMMRDKDYTKAVARIASHADYFIAVTPSLEYRALAKEELVLSAQPYCAHTELGDGFRSAYERAVSLVGEQGVVVICGSLYLATDMRSAILGG